MNTPVFTVPMVTANPLGLIADGTKMNPMLAALPEASAQRHWLFGTDYPTMTDLIVGAAASCAAGAPTMGAGFLTPPASGANYINSGIADAAKQTVWCVYQQNTASGSRGIMGAWHQGGGVGAILFTTTGAVQVFDMGASARTPAPTAPAGTNGLWFFAAKVSSDVTANGVLAGETIYWGTIGGAGLLSYYYPIVKSLDTITNVGWAGSSDGVTLTNPSNLAEAGLFSSALTSFQVAGLMARARVRVTARGPTVY